MCDPDTHARIPGKTVYVLGIGFSKPLGSPTIAEFLPQGLTMLKKNAWGAQPVKSRLRGDDEVEDTRSRDGDIVKEMTELVADYFPVLRAADIDSKEPTIEDLFCLVDLLVGNGPQGDGTNPREVLVRFLVRVCELGLDLHIKALENKRKGSLEQAGGSTLVPAVDLLHCNGDSMNPEELNGRAIVDKNEEKVCLYTAFISQILGATKNWNKTNKVDKLPADFKASAIISLNYDLVVERKFSKSGYSLKTRADSQNPIFKDSKIFYGNGVWSGEEDYKPDWLASVAPVNNEGPTLLPLIKLHGSLNWKQGKNGKLNICEDGKMKAETESPGLWLPTWVRGHFEDVFSCLLRDARSHLRLASRIVIVGYSMPLMDRHLRYLLADAFCWQEAPEVMIYDVRPESEMLMAWERMLGNLGRRIKPVVRTGGLEALVREWRLPGIS